MAQVAAASSLDVFLLVVSLRSHSPLTMPITIERFDVFHQPAEYAGDVFVADNARAQSGGHIAAHGSPVCQRIAVPLHLLPVEALDDGYELR